MPNWVTCRLSVYNVSESRMKQIREFVSSDHFDEGVFRHVPIDFNKIIPMPEELNVHSGSSETVTIDLYRAYCRPESKYDERLGVDEETFKNIRMSGSECLNWFGKYRDPLPDIHQDDEHDLSRKFSLYIEDEKEYPALVCGRRYFLNKLLYGFTSWYDWCRANWGTKWNSCRSKYSDNGWLFETAWSAPLNVIRVLSEIFPDAEFELDYADEDIGNNCGEIHYLNGVVEYERTEFECEQEADEFAINVIYGCNPIDAGFKFDEENGRWVYDFDAEE